MTEDILASESPKAQAADRRPSRSKRGRRLLIAIIIVLLLALIGISVVLANLVIPRGDIASEEDTGGLVWVKSIYGWGSTLDTQLVAPRKAYIDPDGDIWITDAQYMRAIAFSPEGKLVRQVGQDAADPFITIGPVVIGPEGAFYIGDQEMDRVKVFDSSGADIGFFPFPNPIDIAYRNDMMVIGSAAGFAIVDPQNGQPIKLVGTRGSGPDQFDTVNGVAIGEDDTIYTVDTYNNRLSAYDKEGAQIWSAVLGAPANKVNVTGADAVAASRETSAPANLGLPADICIDGNGRLVIIDSFDFSIAVFDPTDGEFIAKYGASGSEDGAFRYPSGIDYDPARDWFAVADTGNHRVQIVRIPGSGKQAALTGVRRALAGPLRACLAPLVLLLVMIIAFFVVRSRRRRAESGQPTPRNDETSVTRAAEESPS